jgi:hypothetical protein
VSGSVRRHARTRIIPVAWLALAWLPACTSDAFLGPAAATSHASIFDQVWNEFDLHYSFFALKHIDWKDARARYRPLALAAANDSGLAVVIEDMMGELQDVHVSLTPFGTGSTTRYVSAFEAADTYFSESRVFGRYVVESSPSADAHLRYGLAAPQTGYVFIPSFLGTDWAHEMDGAIDAMSGITSLIVDVRNDRGGSNQLAVSIAGRFVPSSRTYGYVRLRNGPAYTDFTDYITESVKPVGASRFRGRVFVLTNRHTFSSAEDFVLALRTIPGVTVLGDTTAGASGGPIVRELPNGWTYQLSEWIEYTPGHQPFEGIGLAPDIVVPTSAHDAAQGVDPVFEAALRAARQ